jgi:hypothetical protein
MDDMSRLEVLLPRSRRVELDGWARASGLSASGVVRLALAKFAAEITQAEFAEAKRKRG